MKNLKTTLGSLMILFFCFIFSGFSLVYGGEKPTDKEISEAVEWNIMLNATTPSYMIDIESNSGIVTLSGSVNNILAKDRAVKIAQTIKGVRGVIDKITVDAPERQDMSLEKDIVEALIVDPATDSYEILVDADDGIVTLEGNVDSWQEKQLSEFVAKGIKGVKEVKNNIRINQPSERPDVEIQKDIEMALRNDIRIDDVLIDISVKDGNVELSGAVGSASEKSLASDFAWVAGVKSVDDKKLKVKSWARDEEFRKGKYVSKSDTEIKDAVEDALFYDPRVYSFNPDISVKNGIVTLTGVVDNLKAKRAAEQDAKNVVGVFWVKNYLKVRPEYIPEDNELVSRIENALLRDPIVEKWEIEVKANNGVVYLNGVVDSRFEKMQAEEIASKTLGVMAIENNLDVYDENDYYYYDYVGWNNAFPPYHVDVNDNYISDYEVKKNIESQLWWSPYVNEDEIKVSVNNREATLTGEVDTHREKLYAEINAVEGGAIKVENNLVVDYTP